MKEKITPIISYIAVMFITLVIGSLVISFLIKKSEKPITCDKEHLNFCTTENLCKKIELYWWDNSCHLTEKPEPKPSEYSDYNSLSEMNSLVLVENFEAYVSNISDEKDKNKNTINGIISKNGKISKGYLEIIASINNEPLTSWESIYFKAPIYDRINHGGHIFRPESLKFPPDIEKGEKTHLLFPLNYIPFSSGIPYSESAKPLHFDLFDTMNKSEKIVFLAFISSNTPAKIDLIKIHYECDKDVNDGECELMLKKINKILE